MEDWALQDALPDWTTSNKSALEMVSTLKAMGIENCFFFLALHDQSLKGLNPYSPDLTLEQKSKILKECRVNPWYMFRELARVPAAAGAPAEQLRFNRANICLWWLFYNHVTSILIQPRQTGKSLCSDFIKVEGLNFRAENTRINLFTKDDKLRRENVLNIKKILEAFPSWANMRDKSDLDNTEEITINKYSNSMKTHLPRSSERDAEKVGRGFTSPQHFYDEIPFQSWISVAYPASMSAMDAVIERAKKAGVDYGVVITTTAGRKDDRDGEFVYKMCMSACRWSEKLYDVGNQKQLDFVVRKNSSDGTCTVYAVFYHRQLGYTDEWAKEKIATTKGTKETAERDYLCKWTSGTATSPFTARQADKIRASAIDVEHMEITPEGYVIRWYYPEDRIEQMMASNKYVIGMDTSEAAGGDDIGFFMIDTRTLKVVATAKINETNIITFAQWLSGFMLKYRNTILVPERRSTGSTIIDYLLKILPTKGEDPFKRIFNMVVHDSDLDRERYDDIRGNYRNGDVLVRYRKLFGYATSGSGVTARSRLYSDTLWQIIKKLDCRFGDNDVVDQLLGLEFRNGRIDHKMGGHDDMVISMLLSYWFILYGKNFTFYNLAPYEIMTEIEDTSSLTPMERMQLSEQKKYREELDTLAVQYTKERDEISLRRIEQKMRTLERKLIMEAGEINTVDELIRKLKEEKQINKSSRTTDFYNRRDALNEMPIGSRIFAQEVSIYDLPNTRNGLLRNINQRY